MADTAVLQNQVVIPKKKKSVFQIMILVFLILYVCAIFTPFVWGFITSLKDRNQFLDSKLFGLPEKWRWDNYLTVLEHFKVDYTSASKKLTFSFILMMRNSVVYSVVATTTSTTVLYLTSYACSMYKYKWSTIMEVFCLFSMSMPIFGALPSSIMVFKFLGLYESFFGIAVVIHTGWTSMYFFVVEASIRSIPKAYVEAASIDGANNLQILLRVMFPLTINIYSTMWIISFIGNWNSYTNIYLYLKSFPTAAYGLWKFDNDYSGDVSGVWFKLAAGYLIVIPVMIVFIFFHKQLMNGISLSEGVKE